MEKPERRTLQFADLDEAVHDAESLLARGYDRAGNWDLAQTCGHLTEWLRFPLDGYPRQPAPIRLILWAARNTVGRRQFRKVLESGSLPVGGQTFPETIPAPGGDEAIAVARFREMAARFNAHKGPFQASPFFGEFNRETALRLQLIHCAHHLSFLVPRAANV